MGLALNSLVMLTAENTVSGAHLLSQRLGCIFPAKEEMVDLPPPEPKASLPSFQKKVEPTLVAKPQIWLAAGNTMHPFTPSVKESIFI